MTTVTRETYRFGARVVRGPRWCFNRQDCDYSGSPTIGTLGRRGSASSSWVFVTWDSGYTNDYNVAEGHLAYPDEKDIAMYNASSEERRRLEDERYALEPL